MLVALARVEWVLCAFVEVERCAAALVVACCGRSVGDGRRKRARFGPHYKKLMAGIM